MADENQNPQIAKRIVKNSFALMAARITLSFGTFLLIVSLSRYLDVDGFGIYSTIMTFYATTEIFASLGFANYIPREIGRAPERTGEYLAHSLLSAICCIAFLMIMSYLITPYLGYDPKTVDGIHVAIVALVPAALISISQSFFIAYEKAEYITYLNFIEITARIVSSIYLLYQGRGVLTIVSAFCLFRYLSMICHLIVLFRQIGHPHWGLDYTFFKRFIKDLAVFSSLIVVAGLFSTVEALALSLIKNEAEVGIYNAGYRLVTIWSIIPGSVMNAALPNLSRAYSHNRDQFKMLAEKSIKYLSLIAFPLIIGTTVVADDIVVLLYGQPFSESATVLRLLIWALAPMFWDDALWRFLLASDNEAFALRVTTINLLIMIVLCLLLIPSLSYVGACLVVIIVNTLQAVAYAVQVHLQVVKIEYRRAVTRPLLASLAMGLVAAFLRPYLPLTAVVAISTLSYPAFILLMGAVSIQELTSLWRQLRFKAPYEPEVQSLDN